MLDTAHSLPTPPRPAPLARPTWRGRLPRLDAVDAAFRAPALRRRWSLLEAEGRGAAEAVGAALGVSCALRRLAVSRHPVAGVSFSLRPSPDHAPVVLRLAPDAVAALVQAAGGVETPVLASPPDRLTAAVLGHAVLVALGAVAAAGPLEPALTDAGPADPALWLDLAVDLGGRRATLQLGLGEAAARHLAHRLSHPSSADAAALEAAPPLAGAALAATTAPGRLGLGPVRLRADTVARLAPGDALCPDPRLTLEGGRPVGPAWLALGRGPVLAGRLEAGAFHLDALASLHPTAQEPPMAATDDLPVDVHVVLATVPVPLGDLAGLEAGAVLPLELAEPRVRLVVGDRTLAEGELVDVEGLLGVRILSRS